MRRGEKGLSFIPDACHGSVNQVYRSIFASVPAEQRHETASTRHSFTAKMRSTSSVYAHRMRVLAWSNWKRFATTSNQSGWLSGMSSSMKRMSSTKNEIMYVTYSAR